MAMVLSTQLSYNVTFMEMNERTVCVGKMKEAIREPRQFRLSFLFQSSPIRCFLSFFSRRGPSIANILSTHSFVSQVQSSVHIFSVMCKQKAGVSWGALAVFVCCRGVKAKVEVPYLGIGWYQFELLRIVQEREDATLAKKILLLRDIKTADRRTPYFLAGGGVTDFFTITLHLTQHTTIVVVG
jgi:hypothetical protein